MVGFKMKKITVVLAVLLAGCGGGQETTPLPAMPAIEALAVAKGQRVDVIALDRTTHSLGADISTVGDGGQLIGGRLAGVINQSATQGSWTISQSGGGTINVVSDQLNDVFQFGSGSLVGVAGAATTNMPTTGNASYTGTADVIVNNGTDLTQLTTSQIGVDFRSGWLNVLMTKDDSRWLAINGARVTGNQITGGDLSISQTFAIPAPDSTNLAHMGGFFGDAATEAGGVFFIDNTSIGETFSAQGVYTAKKD